MKHVKLFEQFVNEDKDLEKKTGEYTKIMQSAWSSMLKLKEEEFELGYKRKLLAHQGADKTALNKIDTAIEKNREDQTTKFRAVEKSAANLKDEIGSRRAGAANRVAEAQAQVETYEKYFKLSKMYATKAGKEISQTEKERYEEKAQKFSEAVAYYKKDLENAVSAYKQLTDGQGESEESEEQMEYVVKKFSNLDKLIDALKSVGASYQDGEPWGDSKDEILITVSGDPKKKKEIESAISKSTKIIKRA